jgi:hypothetical protein
MAVASHVRRAQEALHVRTEFWIAEQAEDEDRTTLDLGESVREDGRERCRGRVEVVQHEQDGPVLGERGSKLGSGRGGGRPACSCIGDRCALPPGECGKLGGEAALADPGGA